MHLRSSHSLKEYQCVVAGSLLLGKQTRGGGELFGEDRRPRPTLPHIDKVNKPLPPGRSPDRRAAFNAEMYANLKKM